MDDIPPSYEASIQRDYWSLIAKYVQSPDELCAASRVCHNWHKIYTPLLWGNPALHFGADDERVYTALTKFKKRLRWVRLDVRALTHTLHIPPASAELYEEPRAAWLRDVLRFLPNLQSLIMSQVPFFDHACLLALREHGSKMPPDNDPPAAYAIRLLIAARCANTTQRGLAGALATFPHLVFLDLSRTLGARDKNVLSHFRHMASLQILKLSGLQLRDSDMAVLADSLGLRVRSLDVRDNFLGDESVRFLLQSCIQSIDDSAINDVSTSGGLSGAAYEDWSSGVLKPDPAVLDEFRDESFDERYLNRLTQGIVDRMPSEDRPNAGITHLRIAGNNVSVEGLSRLVKSASLHVLDAGTVDARALFRRAEQSSWSAPDKIESPRFGVRGTEKLTPILAKYARKRLTSLRIEHTVVTRWGTPKSIAPQPWPQLGELGSRSALGESPAAPPTYQVSSNEHTQRQPRERHGYSATSSAAAGNEPKTFISGMSPQPGQGSRDAFNSTKEFTNEIDDGAPDLPATRSSSYGQADDKVQASLTTDLDEDDGSIRARPPSGPQLNLPIMLKDRQEVLSNQCSHPHGLLPSMLPNLRSITLTDVPCYDDSGQIVDALIQFIRRCAAEEAFAQLQTGTESKRSSWSRHRHPNPMRQATGERFSLQSITLEVASPSVTSPSVLLSANSMVQSRPAKSATRGLSSTEDADSEALWVAQQDDFSFFADEEDDGSPRIGRGPQDLMSSTSSERLSRALLDDLTSGPPVSRRPANAAVSQDVVLELIKFRKDRKAAYKNALESGERTVDGYWPGEVKVVRKSVGETAGVDCCRSGSEKGYIYH
ncbi:MAG: hypothetical protein Q9174_000203 [Haloplaca sp. 1 TL-2023]